MIKVRQFDIWTADLDPVEGSEPGKTRPVVVLQSDVLNIRDHTTTIVCAISSQSKSVVSALRISIMPDGFNLLRKPSYILCDQLRAIDNSRLKERLGRLDTEIADQIKKSLKAILNIY